MQDITYGFKADPALAEEALSAVQYLWQSILDSLSGAKRGENPNPEYMKQNQLIIDTLLTTMTMALSSRTISGEARDMILQIFTKNIGARIWYTRSFLHRLNIAFIADYYNLNWCDKFLDVKGLQKLADIGAEVPELKIESSMDITTNTRGLLGVLLNRIYNNMYYDKARERFISEIDEFIKYVGQFLLHSVKRE